jgi:Coenzyme PQQ synthesis protein D (PqqD)
MPSPNPHLRSIVNRDGAVILDIPRNQMVTLNSTGEYIWNKLQQGESTEQIVRQMSAECNTDPLIVEQDVHAFLEQLMSKHLLRG